MKKLIAVFLCIVMLLSCTGCAAEAPRETEDSTGGAPAETTAPVRGQFQKVRQVLEEGWDRLGKTAVPLSVRSDSCEYLNDTGNTKGLKDSSVAYPLVTLCSEMAVNPIAAFRLLVRNGMYTKVDRDTDTFDVQVDEAYLPFELASLPLRTDAGDYQYGLGHEDLVKELLELSSVNMDGLDLEALFLDQTKWEEQPCVHFSYEDNCYYAYFIGYGNAAAYILCIYMRTAQAKAITINDVEFQLLSMRYLEDGAAGGGMHLRQVQSSAVYQAASLITALEQLMMGTSVFASAQPETVESSREYCISIPSEYTMGDHHITITQEFFESGLAGWNEDGSGVEQCSLITYRIVNTKSPYMVD